MSLTFIVLACHLNVAPLKRAEADMEHPPKGCRIIEQQVIDENGGMTPYTCMMQSVIHLPKVMEMYPGWEPRKWTCQNIKPYVKI